MTFHHRWFAAGLALLVAGAGLRAAATQTLGEVAKKEEERRKAVAEPSKTYTNKDLTTAPAPAAPPADAAKPAAGEKKDASKDQDKKADAGKDQGPVKDQAYWSGRIKDLRTKLDRDQTFADALQTKINSLITDFVARDDPAQKAVIARDRGKALDELARVKHEIEQDKKAIADLQEEARKAAVPPGWLRD